MAFFKGNALYLAFFSMKTEGVRAEICGLNSRFLANCLGEGSDVDLLGVVLGGEQVVQLFGVG